MVDSLRRDTTHEIAAAAANQTLADLEALKGNLIVIDPGGGNVDLTLPPEANAAGICLDIQNSADAAETVTVKDDAAATIIVLAQDEAGRVCCDGTAWRGFVGAET